MGVVLGKLLQAAVFCPPTPATRLSAPLEFIRTPHGSLIPVLMLWHTASNGLTFLYNHGNAEDLGQIIFTLDLIRTHFQVNVCCYDYTGYGFSKNVCEGEPCPSPSQERVYSDAETVWSYLTSLHILPEDIVLYGRSLGSGPACYLASLHAHHIRGLILCSPLLSCIQTQVNSNLLKKYDVFDNQSRIPRITCPSLVIHGTKDRVVPFSHGQFFAKNLPFTPLTVWVENAGHNDLQQRGSLAIRHGIAGFLRSTSDRGSESKRLSVVTFENDFCESVVSCSSCQSSGLVSTRYSCSSS